MRIYATLADWPIQGVSLANCGRSEVDIALGPFVKVL
jgi:hypothetical protein